ncbi:hypothetical protein BURPS668_1939 [Burkholderia pseudomallei 668]|nr:hypothetical protein BURPS668_1939 [Burkholderia pseudomallei 668]
MSGAAIEGARAACRASGMRGVASAARSMHDACDVCDVCDVCDACDVCDVCDGGDPGPAHDATTMSVVPARRRRGSRAAYAMMSETRTIGGGAKRADDSPRARCARRTAVAPARCASHARRRSPGHRCHARRGSHPPDAGAASHRTGAAAAGERDAIDRGRAGGAAGPTHAGRAPPRLRARVARAVPASIMTRYARTPRALCRARQAHPMQPPSPRELN